MCELFGMNCNEPVDICFSFTEFKKRSKTHNSGWGIGFYRENSINNDNEMFATIIKEPIPAYMSIFKEFLKTEVRSNMFISHIRLASEGSKVPLNTHPFELMLDPRRESKKEKSWIFAHNGTIRGIKENKMFESEIKTHGNTDSEYAFCYILGYLRGKGRELGYNLTTEQKANFIKEASDKISKQYPKTLNFLMSDGYRLYAYYGGYDGCGGLWHLTRTPPHKELNINDEDGMTVRLNKSGTEVASLVATKSLTEENWIKFKPDTLLVFENGKKIYEQ